MANEKTKSAGLNLGAKASKKDKYIKMTREDIKYYPDAKVSCACGAEYEVGATLPEIRVDICANCHPFFTGRQKLIDTEGRVERFTKKYGQQTVAGLKERQKKQSKAKPTAESTPAG